MTSLVALALGPTHTHSTPTNLSEKDFELTKDIQFLSNFYSDSPNLQERVSSSETHAPTTLSAKMIQPYIFEDSLGALVADVEVVDLSQDTLQSREVKRVLKALEENATRLKKLNLACHWTMKDALCVVPEHGPKDLSEKVSDEDLERLPLTLTSLNLNFCTNISNKGILSLNRLTNLEELRVVGCSEQVKEEALKLHHQGLHIYVGENTHQEPTLIVLDIEQ